MNALQHKKLDHLLNTNRHAAARTFLEELAAKGDTEAQTLRVDMDSTYPVSAIEKGESFARRFLVYVFAGLVIAILIIALLLIITKP